MKAENYKADFERGSMDDPRAALIEDVHRSATGYIMQITGAYVAAQSALLGFSLQRLAAIDLKGTKMLLQCYLAELDGKPKNMKRENEALNRLMIAEEKLQAGHEH